MPVYDRIEEVLRQTGATLAAHEFADLDITPPPTRAFVNARRYVGVTEATLARRLREMRQQGRVTSERRAGEKFVRYTLAPKVAVQVEFPAEQVAA